MGDGVVCLANGLADGAAVEAMLEQFSSGSHQPFPERLLEALAVGREVACGPYGLLSASLLAGTPARRTRVDLRIDVAARSPEEGGDALAELRALRERFRLIADFYEQWPDSPNLAHGNWREWAETASQSAMAEPSRRKSVGTAAAKRR
jgi:uncharacterized Ntn-hydrolase superfamily protein